MSTKLYMTNKISEYADTTPRGEWDDFYAPHLNFMIDTNKYGGQVEIDTIQTTSNAGSHFPNVWSTGTYRGISRRLVPQTISGVFNILMFMQGNVRIYSRLHIFILDTTAGDNAGTVFAELRTFEDSIPYTKETAWSTDALLPVHLVQETPINTVTIPNDGRDYRLVIEFGGVSSIAPGSTLVMNQQRGSRKVDLTGLDDIGTTGGAAAFFFSADIIFKDYVLPFNHEIEFSGEFAILPQNGNVNFYKNHPLWYKVLLPIDCVVACLASNISVRTKNTVYVQQTPNQSSPPVQWMIESDWNAASNIPVVSTRYAYFKITPEATVPSANLRIENVDSSIQAQTTDFLLTATDSNPNLYDSNIIGRYSAMIRTTSGAYRTLTGKFASSRLGVALYAGRFGIVSRPKGELLIYGKAPTFQLLNHVYNGLPSGTIAIGTDFKSFYMLGGHPTISNGAFIFVVKFDQNGVFQPLQWVLPVVGYDGNSPLMGVNRSGTILYYGQGVLGGKVNRHDITTNSGTALSPFITSPGPFNQYVPAYVIVMSDNSICCYFRYYPTPSNQDYIYHYAPDGTLLRAISLSMLGNTAVGQYICHSSDDGPDTIWIWYYTGSPAKDGFLQLRLSDGAILQQFSGYYLFNSGKGPAQLSTEAIWGPETGGAMIPMMFTPGISGMYFFNPAINHDSYYNAIDVKIPNPTVRLPYVGE